MNHPLHQILQEDTLSIFQKGYIFFKTKLLPIVKQANISTDPVLISKGYCVIGDIHDLNGAPKQALKAYQTAIHFDKTNAVAHQEMANVLAQVGRYFEAFQAIHLAMEHEPDHSELMNEKEEYQDSLNYHVEPLFTDNNQLWKWSELLAEEQFKVVMEQILKSKTADMDALKCLNRAYGALGATDLYLENWKKMQHLEDDFEMDYGDWFYMPRRVYEMEEMRVLWRESSLWG